MGQVSGGVLALGLAICLYIYLLPSLVAFLRGHRRFFWLLGLNILVAPAQMGLLHLALPHTMGALSQQQLMLLGAGIMTGPLWLILLGWSLLPVRFPDPRLVAARNTKAFDIFAAIPLILWFGNGVLQNRPLLVSEGQLMLTGGAALFIWAQFIALFGSALFNLVTVYFLVVRDKPVAKSRGALPRLVGFAGTFLGVGILHLPVAQLSLPVQILAALLVGLGSVGSALVLWRLGRAFSIMPEARKLVTGGPYAFARHPLYGMEIIIIIGVALQFQQPWAGLLALAVIALLFARSHFEEQVLREAYPEYAAYRSRTKRFLPGVF